MKTRPDLKKNYEVYGNVTSGTERRRSGFTDVVFIQPGWAEGDKMGDAGWGPTFPSDSKTLIFVFSPLLLHESQTITAAALGTRAGSCSPSKLSPFSSKAETGRRLESTHSYPVMLGSPCPGGAVLCQKHPHPQSLLCRPVWHFILAWVV